MAKLLRHEGTCRGARESEGWINETRRTNDGAAPENRLGRARKLAKKSLRERPGLKTLLIIRKPER